MYRYATVVSALLLTTSAGSLAQTSLGTGFTFQGRVKQAGQLVNDSCDFEFTLWDAETDGGQVGPTLTFDGGNALPVNQGLFSATLDFGAAALNGDERWLEVAVGCPSGEALTPVSPRQELTAAPYASYSLSGKPPSSLDAPDGDPVDAVFVNDDGFVGIGTANPTALLAVEIPHDGFNGYDPIIKLSAWQSGSPTDGGAIDFHVNSVESAFPSSRIIHTMSDSTGGELQFATTEDYTTTIPTTRLTIKDNGNVGIGTTSPQGHFHVVDAADGSTFSVIETTGSEPATGAALRFNRSGVIKKEISINGLNDLELFQGTGSNADAANRMFIRMIQATGFTFFGGNVGVGTTNPAVALDVVGTIQASAGCVCPSDFRLKRDIGRIGGALAKVLGLRGVYYTWRREEFPEKKFDGGRQIGFIAQEIKEILPEAVSGGADDGFYSVNYDRVVPVLVEAIKELHEVMATKDEQIAEMNDRLQRLEALVNSSIATQTEAGRKYSLVSDTDRK